MNIISILYISNEIAEKQIMKIIPHSSYKKKKKKTPRNKFNQDLKDLYNENYKILFKKRIKGKMRMSLCSLIGRINIFKCPQYLVYGFIEVFIHICVVTL